MIVADTNLIAYFVIPGARTESAERVRSKDRNWIAPTLLRSELLNVLAKYIARGILDRDEASKAFHRGISLVKFSNLESEPFDTFNLCHAGDSAPYDAEFVWLAIKLRIPLVT